MNFFPGDLDLIDLIEQPQKCTHLQFFLLLLLQGDDSDGSDFKTAGSSVLVYTLEIPALI